MEMFRLYGSVFVDSSEAKQEISEVTNEASSMGDKLQGAISTAAAVATAVAGVAVTVGKAIFDVVSDVSADLDSVAKEARNMGVSSEWYQEWQFIASRQGTTMDDIAKAVETMEQKVGDASDSTVEALGALGISMIDAKDMAPEDLFELIVTRLAEIEDPSTKASVASDLLGNSWKSLRDVLNMTPQTIEDLKQECIELGGVVGEDGLQKSESFQDALTNWEMAVKGLKSAISVEFMDDIASIITKMTDHVAWLTTNVPAAFDAIRSAINNVCSAVDWFLNLVGGLSGSGTYSAVGDTINDGTHPLLTGMGATRQAEYEEAHGYASGLDYVPYNSFPARLHTGEAVLAGVDAGAWRAGASGGINVTQNITQTSLTEIESASAILQMLENARWL